MGLFTGTSEDYDKYRQLAPKALIDFIVSAVPPPHDTMLDLGTGTGGILEQFLPYFTSAIALDPDAEMLAAAEEHLAGKSVQFLHMPAEDVTVPDGWQAALVTICRAFHWMNRPAVLKTLDGIVRPDGVIAIFGSKSIWRLDDEWSKTALSVVQQFLGTERKTSSGEYNNPTRPYTDDFAESAFTEYAERSFPFEHHFTLESFTGYLHSTSFASNQLLGDKLEDFDRALYAALAPFVIDGELVQHNEFTLVIARRP